MAGAKETPRQKLISLMYLVLLAMLALQVSSAVIFKFEQLNENLELSNIETDNYNKNKLSLLSSEINKRDNPPKVQLDYLKKAEAIRKRTSQVKSYMNELKTNLIESTGGYDDEGNLAGAKEETKVEVMMIGPSKNGKAYELKDKLDEYIAWVNTLKMGKHKPLAYDGKDHPILKSKADQKKKDFANLNFAASPLVASLATLSELEGSVLSIEREVLDAIADSINVQDYKVKGLIPVVKTNSNYVIAGRNYEAEMFLTAQLATETPTMQLGNSSISVDQRGIGAITFKANGGNFDANGLSKRTWTGKINVKKPNGKDTSYTITQNYTVVKPSLQFQAASADILYYNCGNKIAVSVPELGPEFSPKYTSTGGKVQTSSTKGQVTIIPSAPKMEVKVSSDGTYIGTKKFKVIKAPLPTIEVKKGNKTITPMTQVSINDAGKNLKLKITPDSEFKKFSPNDARYKVTKWEVTHGRGRTGKGVLRGSGSKLRLNQKFNDLRSGDKLIIEIKEVKRLNYRGETEVIPLPASVRFQTVFIS